MAPLLEFEPYSTGRARKLVDWAKGQTIYDQVEHVSLGNNVNVVFYKDKREPTVIHHKVRRAFEKWGGHRVFGEQEVLDEIQESIGERGVIFELSTATADDERMVASADPD